MGRVGEEGEPISRNRAAAQPVGRTRRVPLLAAGAHLAALPLQPTHALLLPLSTHLQGGREREMMDKEAGDR